MTKFTVKKTRSQILQQLVQNVFSKLGLLIILSAIFLIIILLILLFLRFELFIEGGDSIELDDLLKRLSDKVKSNIMLSELTGEDFGKDSNYMSDLGGKFSTDATEWGFNFNHQFGKYYSTDRSRDAKIFANVCDYLFKIHDVKNINKETVSIVFSENQSAQEWFSDYDNSWGKKKDDNYENTLKFRDHLRSIKYYKNYKK